MDIKKVYNVLQILSEDRIETVTKEALIKAFNDDGIFDLEGAAAQMLKRLKHDRELEKTEPFHLGFSPLALSSREVASRIVHKVPEVPFVLDGITYDPKDIRRFDGEVLVFIPLVGTNATTYLQVFREDFKQTLATYLQFKQISKLLNPADFSIPGVPDPTPPGQPTGTYNPNDPPPSVFGCGGLTGIPCGQPPVNSGQNPPPKPPPPPPEPTAPQTGTQIQMFDRTNYAGNWFWLDAEFMWDDLTNVSRGGFFGGDWNDEIWSISSSISYCLFFEHIHQQGSVLLQVPKTPFSNLARLGWNARISSVRNFGPL